MTLSKDGKIDLTFGRMAPTLTKQLKRQGYRFKNYTDDGDFAMIRAALNIVRVAKLFNDAECADARDRLMDKIVAKIEPIPEDVEADTDVLP